MEKGSRVKAVGAGLLVGGVATGLLRGFDVWVIAVSLSGAFVLLAVIVKHGLPRAV